MTVGRAAEMLRMSPRAVRLYIQSGAMQAERVDGAGQSVQFVCSRARCSLPDALADKRERRPPHVPSQQLQLPLRPPSRMKAPPWPQRRPTLLRTAPSANAACTKAKGLLPDREAKGEKAEGFPPCRITAIP